MNARQKAKYWKKKYDELANLPVRPTIVVSDRKVERLSYTTIIDYELYMKGVNNPELQRIILGEVVDKLADRAKNFVDITVERDTFSGGWRFNGRLDIARPFRDYHDIYNTHCDVMHDTNYKGHGRREE